MTLQERHPEIREYEVKDRLARPVNPWEPTDEDRESINPIAVYLCRKWSDFESAHRDKVYPTELPPGKYNAEELKEVWQYKPLSYVWKDCEPVGYQNYTYEEWSKELGYHSVETRIFITRADQPEGKEAICTCEFGGFTKDKNYRYNLDANGDPEFTNDNGYKHSFSKHVVKDYFTPINSNAGEKETVNDFYVIVNGSAELVNGILYKTKEEADKICIANPLGSYFSTLLSDHIDSMHSWYDSISHRSLEESDQQLHHLQTEISEKDAQIERLTAVLGELWPLSTNAFAELTVDEIANNPILNRLSLTIDKAKELLSPP